jgi:hypothetical protein
MGPQALGGRKSITLQKLVKRFHQEKNQKNTVSKNSKNEWQEMYEKSMPLLIVVHHD